MNKRHKQLFQDDIWIYYIFPKLNSKELGIFAISCKSLYARFGGFMKMLQLAVNTKDHLTLQLATQVPVELTTLMHTQKQDIIAATFDCVPRSLISDWSRMLGVVAGGFVRSLIVKIMKKCHISIKCEDEAYGDIDMWVCGFGFIHHSSLISLNINRIQLPQRMRDVYQKSGNLHSIIMCFDWTPIQASLDYQQNIYVTPACLFSIITGQMYLVARPHFKWPFSFSFPDFCNCGRTVLFDTRQKRRLLQRFIKYIEKGYVDPFITSNEVNRMMEEVSLIGPYVRYSDFRDTNDRQCACDWLNFPS